MDGLVVIKASDLAAILDEIKAMREELRQYREMEEQIRCYSIQKTADLLDLHYNTVRNLLTEGKLKGNHIHGESGKCTIPYWSIKAYVDQHKPKDK